jgi:hypothetical protein
MKMPVFWVIALCTVIEISRTSSGIHIERARRTVMLNEFRFF